MPKVLRRFACLLPVIWSGLFVLTFCQPVLSQIQKKTGAVPGRFIIKLKSSIQPDRVHISLGVKQTLTRLIPTAAGMTSKSGHDQWAQYFILEDSTASQTVTDIQNKLGNDVVEWVEPDYYIEFFDWPADSLFSNQWYLSNEGQSFLGIKRRSGFYNDSLIVKQGTAGFDVGLAPLYDTPPPEATRVVVAIIDTGVDPNHPELQGQFWRNEDEIPRNLIDDDHNGFVDDTLGYDVSGNRFSFFNPVGDNDPTDTIGHGTHIAGIIAARADDAGIVGIAPHAMVMPLKIYPNALTSIGAAAVIYAVMNGADVISISWGSPFLSGVLRDALGFARKNNVFVAIAAGNSGNNERFFPAAYDSSFVVGATNPNGGVTAFSTVGAHIDIVAPGEDILSLRAAETDMYASAGEPDAHIVDSLYYLSDGTSMSTPMVAAAAALLFSIQPNQRVQDIEEVLLLAANDLLDPYGGGENFPGKDSISGYGSLNIAQSVTLSSSNGIFLISPEQGRRYTNDIIVKAVGLRGFNGAWHLFRSASGLDDSFVEVASGIQIPNDSILFIQSDTEVQGNLVFQVRDDLQRIHERRCTYVTQRKLEITSPTSGDSLQYSIPIHGSVFGPDFDSVLLFSQKVGGAPTRLLRSTSEYFDSLLFPWTVSGDDTGSFRISLHGYFNGQQIVDTVGIRVQSAFAVGWPKSFPSRGAISPVAADLDHDGYTEIILGTQAGLYVWSIVDDLVYLLPGYPAQANVDLRTIPAIYDVDGNGFDDIICTGKDGLYVFQYNGTQVAGFPRYCTTGEIPYGFGYPVPRVTQLNAGEDSAIIFINMIGEVLGYRFTGESYYYSLKGLFSSLDPRISNFQAFGGFTWPFVSSADLDGDTINEVIASYVSAEPYAGISILEGRTGRPAWGREQASVLGLANIDGVVLGDLDGDSLPEIVTSGYDSTGLPQVWALTKGTDNLLGWPIPLPQVRDWATTYPTLADLDLDGRPEVILSFFEYDVGSLYIFRWDGTPYLSKPGLSFGEAFFVSATLGTPVVADVIGDEHPEIIVRSGYILPGTGFELLHIIDHTGNEIPGYPIATPTSKSSVFATQFAPLVADVDKDGLVEVVLVGDGNNLFVWNFPASSRNGENVGRIFFDNLNTGVLPKRDEQLIPALSGRR